MTAALRCWRVSLCRCACGRSEAQKLRDALTEFEQQKSEWEAQKSAESLRLKQIGAELKKEWDLLAKAKAKLQAEGGGQ